MNVKTRNRNKHRNKHIALLLSVLLAVAVMTGCAAGDNAPAADVPSNEAAPEASGDARSVGTGSNSFALEITGASGETVTWNVHTDESIVSAALLEHDLISGEETDFGLMVTHVNGERADFVEDGAYWAFYIDGEFASVGVDATEIEQGKVYAFVYTEA